MEDTMSKLGITCKLGILSLGGVAMAVGIAALAYNPVHAARPAPDCGPTREWTCVVPGCPSCSSILFEGTVCEKTQYEKKTGRVCSPA